MTAAVWWERFDFAACKAMVLVMGTVHIDSNIER
jgi:hypothetical protein